MKPSEIISALDAPTPAKAEEPPKWRNGDLKSDTGAVRAHDGSVFEVERAIADAEYRMKNLSAWKTYRKNREIAAKEKAEADGYANIKRVRAEEKASKLAAEAVDAEDRAAASEAREDRIRARIEAGS